MQILCLYYRLYKIQYKSNCWINQMFNFKTYFTHFIVNDSKHSKHCLRHHSVSDCFQTFSVVLTCVPQLQTSPSQKQGDIFFLNNTKSVKYIRPNIFFINVYFCASSHNDFIRVYLVKPIRCRVIYLFLSLTPCNRSKPFCSSSLDDGRGLSVKLAEVFLTAGGSFIQHTDIVQGNMTFM